MVGAIVTDLQSLIGSPPVGCEPLEYIVASAIVLILCQSCISMISGIFRWIGGM